MSSSSSPLILLPGSYYIPKSNPKKPAGEDSHFIVDATTTQVIGVADGVGGWALKGIDAGEYSRTLMKNAELSVLGGRKYPENILFEAHMNTQTKGSSTVCIVSLDGTTLRAANLGDSGFLVIRDNNVIFKSPTQQHRFNHPYQIGMGIGDDPMLDVDSMDVEVEDRDVVVLGTDGLFDNMFDQDILEVVGNCLAQGKGPSAIAWELADLAVSYSLDSNRTSPFTVAAHEEGLTHYGGKYDDVTVVAAYVWRPF